MSQGTIAHQRTENKVLGRPHHFDDERDDGIDLGEYLLVLWHRRLLIVGVVAACCIVTFIVNLRMQPTYEATAQLVINQSKLGEQNAPQVTAGMVASYKALLDNHSLADRVVKEFGLDKPPYKLTPLEFQNDIVSSDIVRDTNVIVIRVRLPDRQLAARVANGLTRYAVELAQRLSQGEAVRASDIIKVQLDQSKTRLDSSQKALEEFKRTAQVELLKKDVEAILGQRKDLLGLLVDIQEERGRLAAAEAQLAQKQKIDTMKRSLDTEPAMLEAARAGSSTGDTKLLPLEMKSESVNPVYVQLEQRVANSRTNLAALEKRRDEVVNVRKLDSGQLSKLSELYDKEAELARHETEFELAKKVYVDVATMYEQSRLQVASRAAQLQVLDEAIAPDVPIGPKPLRNTLIALIVALIAASLAVLLMDFIATSRRPDLDAAR